MQILGMMDVRDEEGASFAGAVYHSASLRQLPWQYVSTYIHILGDVHDRPSELQLLLVLMCLGDVNYPFIMGTRR